MRPIDWYSDFISQSQERCRDSFQLERTKPSAAPRLTNSEIIRRKGAIDEVLSRNGARIRGLRQLAREAGYCVLISDAEGAVVQQFGDSARARNLADQGLKCGTLWREDLAGTNAISMALLSREAFTVAGNDHFFYSFSPFMCTAAPILDHDDELLGSIDLSGINTANGEHLTFVRHFVSQSAAGMQADLFLHRHHDKLIMRLTSNEIAGSNTLVAIGMSGRIEAITRKAARILSADQAPTLVGRPLEDLMSIDLDTLERTTGKGQIIETSGPGRCVAVTLAAPVRDGAIRAKPGNQARNSGARIAHEGSRQGEFSLEQLAGKDPVMLKHVALVRRLADRHIPIMLQGETGTGKDAFAKAMHAASARAAKPFVAVNCAAAPESLLDSELFGYAPGTFTGGLKNGKVGKIAASSGGTLLLDEIGDMPLDLQGRLLRVLAENEVVPLGTVDPVAVDLTVVCATNRDLYQLVLRGTFREDLYYRLNGAKLTIPSLRERKDVDHIIATLLESEGRVRISPEALEFLASHPWPGNIRQLINAVRYAIACCNGKTITLADLPEDLHSGLPDAARRNDIGDIIPPARLASTSSLNRMRVEVERQQLVQALQLESWVVTDAARRLGISRATMHRKMTSHGISRPE